MVAQSPEKVDLSKYVEVNAGRAMVRGRRLPVAFIATAARAAGTTIPDLMYQYTLSEEQVLAALLYYREHQADIDALDADEAAESHALQQRHGIRMPYFTAAADDPAGAGG